jgi:hypothetical protein
MPNFAKLVELFDTHNVSFVSVTQQFNTTTTAQCEHGFVKLVAGDWNQTFVDELCAFPNGAHDDQVDAASSAFRALMRRVTWHAVAAWSELRAGEEAIGAVGRPVKSVHHDDVRASWWRPPTRKASKAYFLMIYPPCRDGCRRRAPGGRPAAQPLGANLDCQIVVFAAGHNSLTRSTGT